MEKQLPKDLGTTRSSVTRRSEIADFVPFFLRAWWLRDRVENSLISFGAFPSATLPLWSLHSDPVCDAANLDSGNQ